MMKYNEEDILDDEEEELLKTGLRIREKEKMCHLKSIMNNTEGPRISRKIGQKYQRTMEKFEEEMSSLGIDLSKKRLRNLEEDSSRPIRGKKMTVGRTPSLSAKRAPPRDVQGLPDLESYDKTQKIRRKGQAPFNRDARKGEGDRHIFDMKPKHLFSGKRKMGKADHR